MGRIDVSGGGSKTDTRETVLPFVPFYPEPAKNGPQNAKERAKWFKNWREKMLNDKGDIEKHWKTPKTHTESHFATDRSLAAEIWRIRASIHDAVINSSQENGGFIFPESLEMTRIYKVTDKQGITIADSSALANFGTSRTKTSQGTLKIEFARNNSVDPQQCNSDSLPKPKS